MGKSRKRIPALESDQYILYRGLFPERETINTPFHTVKDILYMHAKERFPERFNFNILNELFKAWRDSGDFTPSNVKAYFKFEEIKSGENIHKKEAYNFTYDKLIWRADILVKSSFYNGRWTKETHLKFPNDGFMYNDDDEFKKLLDNIKRHRYDSWCLIDRKNYDSTIPDIFSWAQNFFGETPKVQFFYCFEGERIDIKFKKEGEIDPLIITFEPGYPEDFVDLWQ